MKLAERIIDCAPTDPHGNPRSAVFGWFEQWKAEHPQEAILMEEAQEPLMSMEDIEEAGGEWS